MPNGELFCWVLTTSKYHNTRVPAINQTWLKRCDFGRFLTNDIMHNSSIPHIPLFRSLYDSHENLFPKTILALTYIYRNISSKFDWYLKADDDLYVIVENLKHFLRKYNSSESHYLGFRFKPYLLHGYNSGGAGYVLSNKAMKLLTEAIENDQNFCSHSKWEDVGLGQCLEKLQIYPEKTSETNGAQRFLPFHFHQMLSGYVAGGDNDFYLPKDEKLIKVFFVPKSMGFSKI
uniref:N-acetylgalactosaminide beta-1,3-galactosyltransferase n=1 Tax=Acrobeloides nanus TaxID=290746 RepID=A0A914DNT3_9BILA